MKEAWQRSCNPQEERADHNRHAEAAQETEQAWGVLPEAGEQRFGEQPESDAQEPVGDKELALTALFSGPHKPLETHKH